MTGPMTGPAEYPIKRIPAIEVLPIPLTRPSACDHAPFLADGRFFDGHTTHDNGEMRDSVLAALIAVEPCSIERGILERMLLRRAYRIGGAA